MQSAVKLIALFTGLLMLGSCSKKEALPAPDSTDSLGKINKWVLDSMRRFYYWSDQIPSNPDYALSPELFFKSLLSVNDRFSHISGPDVPPASNAYFTFGCQYAFLQVPGLDQYIGVVTFINNGGAADQAGFKRGSYFIQVNGMPVNAQNMGKVNQLLNSSGHLMLTTATYQNNTWKAGDTKALDPYYQSENAVYYTRLFSGNSNKTGYLYYTSFNENVDESLLTAFAKFKREGVSELIVDLRYNAGGSIASCAKLAALIAGNLGSNDIFAVYQGNQQEGKHAHSLQSVLNTSANATGRRFADLQPGQLQLNRVFVLTTNATASSAELLVNNLKPFINVIQIGETTTGKDEASFTIKDLHNPPLIDWTLQPIVYKLFNKNNEGGYAGGLVPQYKLSETGTLPLGDIGTNKDVLIHKALEIIYGAGYNGDPTDLRIPALHPVLSATTIYRSAVEQASKAAPVLIR
ncbi:S41 family peptidase [Chitinophaga sp. 22321]|uniref:C-terminal processing protease CtpA/Prc, contains a PDZ domain n=1 Tax=Chitinophaga hostae TaxID=2831022 RepID=A0ABS5J5D0_9BACT|nr:hypothetical protein [Chitinophaga hostae]